MTKDRIRRFLEEDGMARNRPWDIVHPGESSREFGHGQASYETPIPISKESSGSEEPKIFGITFRTEAEAIRFWRAWHRRPFPGLSEDSSTPDPHASLLHVDLTW